MVFYPGISKFLLLIFCILTVFPTCFSFFFSFVLIFSVYFLFVPYFLFYFFQSENGGYFFSPKILHTKDIRPKKNFYTKIFSFFYTKIYKAKFLHQVFYTKIFAFLHQFFVFFYQILKFRKRFFGAPLKKKHFWLECKKTKKVKTYSSLEFITITCI